MRLLMTRSHVQPISTMPRYLRCCVQTQLCSCHSLSHELIDMDFLKSAVASAISKGYPAFGYTFGDRVDIDDSIWTLHNGTKRVWPGCLHPSVLAS